VNTLVLILLIVLLCGGFGWHRSGYYGGLYLGGGLGLVLVILIILALLGRL
jgi:hypothetical protein